MRFMYEGDPPGERPSGRILRAIAWIVILGLVLTMLVIALDVLLVDVISRHAP